MSQPASTGDGPIEDRNLSVDDIENFLNEDPVDTKPDDTGDDKPKPEDKVETLDIKVDDDGDDDDDKVDDDDKDDKDKEELDLKLDDPDDDDNLELTVSPRRQEVLAKYPKFFEEFPGLEKAWYREQKFTELFGSMEDAEEVKDRADSAGEFETQLLEQGNIEPILKAVKDANPEIFKKVADDYMQVLANVDSDAYFHVTGNVIKRTVLAMAEQAQNLGEDEGKQLRGAAHLVHQFIFGPGAKPTAPVNLYQGKQDTTEEDKLESDRQEFAKERFETAREDLSGKIERTIRATIDDNIDPKGQMSSYVKGHAVSEAAELLNTAINADTRFTRIIDNLWTKSFEAGYSRPSQKQIRSTFMSMAKTLLPGVIKKSRRNALKGLGQRTSSEPKTSRTRTRQGRVSDKRSSQDKQPSGDGRGMKTVDFFNED